MAQVNGVSVSRLMALGLLAEQGPMHGHRIRREAEEKNVESWGGVSVGALYRELHKMARDGLIEELRCEQVGGRPERTVYRITAEGRRELDILRERAMADVHRRPDPVGVALLFAGRGEPGELEEHLRFRRQALDNLLQSSRSERGRLMAAGRLTPQAIAVFRRGELFLEAELAWHDEYEMHLLASDDRASRRAGELAGLAPNLIVRAGLVPRANDHATLHPDGDEGALPCQDDHATLLYRTSERAPSPHYEETSR